jgi:hypothetical protein
MRRFTHKEHEAAALATETAPATVESPRYGSAVRIESIQLAVLSYPEGRNRLAWNMT